MTEKKVCLWFDVPNEVIKKSKEKDKNVAIQEIAKTEWAREWSSAICKRFFDDDEVPEQCIEMASEQIAEGVVDGDGDSEVDELADKMKKNWVKSVS